MQRYIEDEYEDDDDHSLASPCFLGPGPRYISGDSDTSLVYDCKHNPVFADENEPGDRQAKTQGISDSKDEDDAANTAPSRRRDSQACCECINTGVACDFDSDIPGPCSPCRRRNRQCPGPPGGRPKDNAPDRESAAHIDVRALEDEIQRLRELCRANGIDVGKAEPPSAPVKTAMSANEPERAIATSEKTSEQNLSASERLRAIPKQRCTSRKRSVALKDSAPVSGMGNL